MEQGRAFRLASWRQWIPTVGWWMALVALAVALKWGHLVNQDEGLTLTGAWQVGNGLVPYRDFFYFVTPGSFYLLAVAFRAFGASYLVAKIFSLILLLLSAVGLNRIGRYLGLGRERYLAILLWLLLSDHYVLINHNTYALVAAIWAIERILWIESGPRAAVMASAAARHWAAYGTAGLMIGITGWMHQARGAAVLVAAIGYACFVRRRAILPLAVGAGLAFAPLLSWPWPLLWDNLVRYPLFSYYPTHRGRPDLLLLMLSGYLLLAVALHFLRWPKEWRFLWLTGLLLTLSTFSQPDHFHLLPTLFAPALLAVAGYRRAVGARSRWRIPLAVALGSGTFALGVASLVPFSLRVASVGWWNFVRLRDPQLERLVAYVQAEVPAARPIFVAPFLPNFYFETQRRNPTRFNALLHGNDPPQFFVEARRALERDPPPVVLLNYPIAPEDLPSFMVGDVLVDYFRQNYRYVTTINGVQVYRRRADSALSSGNG